jgi:hypothetical protein
MFKDVPILGELPNIVQQQILVGGATAAGSYIYQKFLADEPPQEEGETMEEYLARRKENVGNKMRTYFDNYFKFDPEYSALDDAGKNAFVARYNLKKGGRIGYSSGSGEKAFSKEENLKRFEAAKKLAKEKGISLQEALDITLSDSYRIEEADGGRVGYQTGGITMANTLAENIRRNIANQAAVAQQFQAARSRLPGYVAPQKIAAPTPTPIEPDMPIGKFPMPPGGDVQPILPVMPDQPGLFPQPPKKIIQPEERVVKKPIDIVDFYEEVTQPGGPADDMMFTKQPVEPDPNIPVEELIDGPIDEIDMTRPPGTPSGDGALTVMPQYNDPLPQDQLLSGFEQFKKDNPEVMQGAGTAAMIPVTLPGGYSYDFSGSLEANAFRKYLESIGQAPYQGRRQPLSLKDIDQTGMPRTITQDDIDTFNFTDPMLVGFDYSKEINWSPGQPAPEGYRVVNMMGDEFLERKFPSKEEVAGLPMVFSGGGRVRFSEGANLKIKLKQIGYEDTLLDKLSLKELRELLDSEKGTFTDQGTYREPAKKGGMPTGIMKTNKAGVMERDYRDKGGFVPVGIKEKADDVPAMLSKNEFVFTADAVRGAGNGSIEKGAQKMYDTMKKLEKRVV